MCKNTIYLFLITFLILSVVNIYGVDCNDPNCTKKVTDYMGRCVCTEWTGTGGPTGPASNTTYISLVGDKILVLDGVEHVQTMPFDLKKINSNHENLIISMSGAAVGTGSLDGEPANRFETITYGSSPLETSDFGDGIYKKAYEFVDKKTVAVIGYPWFLGLPSDGDGHMFGPDPYFFALRIQAALNKMAPNRKLVLIGKSMGGCKMRAAAKELHYLGVKVDLLIIVDGSCTFVDQSGIYKNVFSNVNKVYNFHQTTPYPNNDFQNGFRVSFSTPTEGHDIAVNEYDPFVESVMCPSIGHDDIDECLSVHSYITNIVNREIINLDISPILDLLLND